MLILNLLQSPITLLAFLVALLTGITIHEFAHAWMANRSGDPTARLDGRLTLNPMAHLDPLGTIFLFLVGFGWGKPVPVNPNNFKKKSDELKVAIAGIATNIIFAFIIAIPIRIALLQGHMIDSSMLLYFLNIIVEINIFLAVFNLIPIFPLDGSHFIEYFLEGEARYSFQLYGPYILIGLIILGNFTGHSVLFQIMEPVIRFLSWIIKGTSLTGII